MRNDELNISVPAKLLYEVAALASGYTMNRGRYINKSVISEANHLLHEAGYEYGFEDEPLFLLND